MKTSKVFHDQLISSCVNDSLPIYLVSLIHAPTQLSDFIFFQAKCGGSLEMWESSGWIKECDPYGWFMWYTRFYLGRRTDDDERQIGRWKALTGDKVRNLKPG